MLACSPRRDALLGEGSYVWEAERGLTGTETGAEIALMVVPH